MKSINPIIIAEVGVNHNGNLNLLNKLIDSVSKTGVDFIKFQAFIADRLVIKNSPKANYQKKIKLSQYDMLKKYELKSKNYDLIFKRCKKKKIKPLFSVFDIESLSLLKKYKIKNIKIPSGEITNEPLLHEIGKMKIKVFLSTGMSSLDEIKRALSTLQSRGTPKKNISILHCHSEYPSIFKDLNLKSMLTLKRIFGCKIGFSDHSIGKLASIVASSLGAEVIEKHVTLKNNLYGPDHSSSLPVKDLKNFVENVRNARIIIGKKKFLRSKVENQNKKIVRKSLVAKKKIKKGETFLQSNLTCKRPGTGLSPYLLKKIIGTKSKFNFGIDQLIKLK
tara:strand:- start:97 stop:1101 length:1005 start_codon:yes stop_codon:yes gene_type:complete